MAFERFFSVRMHASRAERHLSGAERIVAAEKVEFVAVELIQRAMSKDCPPDRISINIDAFGDRSLRTMSALDVVTLTAPAAAAGISIAVTALQQAGVSLRAAQQAITDISRGASPSGQVMRGAMIVDAQSGSRLEPDPHRGVRASRFDWSDEAAADIKRKLSARSPMLPGSLQNYAGPMIPNIPRDISRRPERVICGYLF